MLLHNKNAYKEYFFLAIACFADSLHCLNHMLIVTGDMIRWPHLFMISAPFEYLMPVVFFLGMKKYMSPDKPLSPLWLLMLLPSLFQFIDFIPFYLSDSSIKIQAYQQMMKEVSGLQKQDYGITPAFYHLYVKVFISVVVVILLWINFVEFYKNPYKKGALSHSGGLLWTFFCLLSFSILAFQPIVTELLFTGFREIQTAYCNIICISSLGIGILFFTNPKIVHGFPEYYSYSEPEEPEEEIPAMVPELISEQNEEKEEAISKFTLSDDLLEHYQQKMLNFFEQDKPYLQPGYSAVMLSDDLKIPRHHLTYLLKEKMNIRFNDFINQYRIEYAIQCMKEQPDFKIDAYAIQSGFTAKTTFNRAFLKHTGSVPSDYLTKINEKSNR